MPITKLRPSFTFTEDRLQQLKSVVPEAFVEGKISWDVLREALGGHLEDENSEHFGLFWPGKRDARRLASIPSNGTLVPVPGEGVNEETTRNIFIEGENLEVLKLLQKSYAGRVKMIYIDPPYNTGDDKLYVDDYSEPLGAYLRRAGATDEEGSLLTTNSRADGRFHSVWMSMMFPRLIICRQLLRSDGILFASIDDGELSHFRMILNEIFGEENALPILVWNRGHSQQQGIFKEYHEYILGYTRDRDALGPFGGGSGEIVAGAMKKVSKANPASDFDFPAGVRCEAPDGTEFKGTWGEVEKTALVRGRFVVANGKLAEEVVLRAGWTQAKQMRDYFAGKDVRDSRGQRVLEFYFSASGKVKCRKERVRVTPSTVLEGYGTQSMATDELAQLFGGESPMSYPKPKRLLKDLISWGAPAPEDLIVDFFAGSATTADAALELSQETGVPRRFIMVQLPELTSEDSVARRMGLSTIADVARERMRRAAHELSNEALEGNPSPGEVGAPGFKAYELVKSQFREWADYLGMTVGEYQMSLDAAARSPLVADWKADALFVEVMLSEGFPLDSTIHGPEAFGPNSVRRVQADTSDFGLHVCLDDQISPEAVDRIIALPKSEVFVCLDRSLTDELKMRLADAINLHVI